MKQPLILSLIIVFCFVSLSAINVEQNQQLPVDQNTGLITYQDVVQTEGNKDELWNRLIGWVNTHYVNPTDATRVRNRENGLVEIVHRFRIFNEGEDGIQNDAGIILYTLKIELREGRYRYTLNNFTLRQAARFPVERWLDKSDRAYNPLWDEYLKQVDAFAISLIDSLVAGMTPEEVITEEEW
jgi:hypothetical protein